MKVVHAIHFRVFCDDKEKKEMEDALKELVLLGSPKPIVNSTAAEGFNERKILILESVIEKTTFVNAFLKELKKKLSEEDKESIVKQAQQRVDDDLNFFLRFEKRTWIDKQNLLLTEKGECFHLRMNLAAYPKKKEQGITIVKEMFKK